MQLDGPVNQAEARLTWNGTGVFDCLNLSARKVVWRGTADLDGIFDRLAVT